MSAAKLAVFAALKATGRCFLIFACRVIFSFTFSTRKRYNFSHNKKVGEGTKSPLTIILLLNFGS